MPGYYKPSTQSIITTMPTVQWWRKGIEAWHESHDDWAMC
jgi:hypothetical protein